MLLTIKRYASSDYDDVWALHQKTISENFGFVKNLAFHTDIHNIPSTYETFFIMRDGEQIIGMVGLKRIDDKTLEIKRLQVAAKHQGKGYGKRLMERALNYAHESGAFYLRLDISDSQAKAYNLYLSMGFKITHVSVEAFGPDNEGFLTTYMEKELGQT